MTTDYAQATQKSYFRGHEWDAAKGYCNASVKMHLHYWKDHALLITGHWYHERILCRWLCLCVYGSLKNTSLNAHIFLLNNIFPKFLTSIFLSLFPYHYYFLRHLIHTHIFFITYSRCALGEFYEKVFFVFDFLFCKLNYPPLTENCIWSQEKTYFNNHPF